MIWSKSVTSLIAVVVLSSGAQQRNVKSDAQMDVDAGLIDGTVCYDDGKPVKGATVNAVPLGRPMSTLIPYAQTDDTGYFAIHIPRSWFGKVAVAAKKEDEDYPDMSMEFYNDGKFETVKLTSDRSVATVAIRLGPKAGVLLGTVADAVTGEPLSPCVELERELEPKNFMRGSGLVKSKYRLLVPPEAGILVKMWLDGYKPWYYPGTIDKSARQPVRLRSGEEMTVDVLLQPEAGIVESGCPKPIGTTVNSRLVG
jgi:hypothetical protein